MAMLALDTLKAAAYDLSAIGEDFSSLSERQVSFTFYLLYCFFLQFTLCTLTSMQSVSLHNLYIPYHFDMLCFYDQTDNIECMSICYGMYLVRAQMFYI